ncbi:unnamed protein product [Nezara viridula]|uniref:Uncharacterized protein n=1 Tax=Nezara viridula TaxID=85310 RepID=A0A9P0HC24_NEZVI|nr:unnamed protein product [Nezara viridula]
MPPAARSLTPSYPPKGGTITAGKKQRQKTPLGCGTASADPLTVLGPLGNNRLFRRTVLGLRDAPGTEGCNEIPRVPDRVQVGYDTMQNALHSIYIM